MHFFLISSLGKGFQWLLETGSFFIWGTKKWLLVALDRWSSNARTVVQELAWVDSSVVILGKWSSYRGGRLSRFDCNIKITL